MKKTIYAIAIGATLFCGAAFNAAAATITFSDADGVYGNYVSNGPSSYQSQGYTFAAITTPGDGDQAHFHPNIEDGGTIYMHDNYSTVPDTYRLTSAAGAFDLTSFTTLNAGLSWRVNGGAYQSAAAGLNLLSLVGVSTLEFTGTGSLTELAVAPDSASSVPEPSSLALLGLGLAGLALRRRKQA